MGVSLECWRGRIGCFILRNFKSQLKMKKLTPSGSLLQLFLLLNLLMYISGVTLSTQDSIVLKTNDQGNDNFHDAQRSVQPGIQIVHCKVPFISRFLEMCSDVEMNPGPVDQPTSHSDEYKLQLDQLQSAHTKKSVTKAVLEKLIHEEGYSFREETTGDGNCFFHAIVDQLQRDKDNDTDDHLQLRQSVVNYLHDKRYLGDQTDKYEFVSGYETWTDYIQIMKKDGTWADHLLVMATADFLQRDIWIFTSSQKGDYPKINCIKIGNRCHPHGEPLVVAHCHEMHYRSLERTDRPSQAMAGQSINSVLLSGSVENSNVANTVHGGMGNTTYNEAISKESEGSVVKYNIANIVHEGMGNTYNIYQVAAPGIMDAVAAPGIMDAVAAPGIMDAVAAPGIMDADSVDLQIKETKETFIETSIYRLVKTTLKTYGHVTIIGAPGEGKTSLALILGDEYKRKGYNIVFVNDEMLFKMESVSNKKTYCIFDDFFGTESLDYISKLEKILPCLERKVRISREKATQVNEENDLLIVFTSKSYNFTSGMSKLPKIKQFMNPTIVDATINKYNQSDMEKMFMKHKENQNICESLPVEQICKLKMSTFGFPLTCKIYFQLLYWKGIDALEFFNEPIAYLEQELQSIIQSENKWSAALILMMLCEDGLNVLHLEAGDGLLEKRIKKVQELMDIKRTDIAEAARTLRGTFFTKGDIIYFSHPAITDACAFAIFYKFHAFLLQNASMKFLYERIHPDLSDETKRDTDRNTISISMDNTSFIVDRFADNIEHGQYSMTVSHPILKNRSVVQELFRKLNIKHGIKSPLVNFHSKDKDKCFLHWAVQARSVYWIEEILKIEPDFTRDEVEQACEACALCGHTSVMKLLFKNFSSKLSDTVVYNLALVVAYTGNNEMFDCLPLDVQSLSPHLPQSSQGHNLLQAACIGGGIEIVEQISKRFDINKQDHYGQTAIMLAVTNRKRDVVIFLTKMGADLKLRNMEGDTVLHLACGVGDISLVKYLLPLCDINSKGKYNRTPLMTASVNSKTEVIDILLANCADVTLRDKHGDSVLHLACQGGNSSLVKHILPSPDIKNRGMNGWTPVMYAAVSGMKDVFDLLVANGADLTQTDNYGNTLLHLACQGGNICIVEHFLPSTDINSRGNHGRTAVMKAAYIGQKEIFDLLVANGADVNITDKYGDNLLHLACWGGNTLMIGEILQQLLPPFDINSLGNIDRTAVMKAAFNGKKEVFDLLVQRGADLTLTDKYGNTILHLACMGGNISIIEHIEHRLPSFDINRRGQNGWTPVMIAAYFGNKELFDLLLTKKADLTLTDIHEDTVLHIASRGGNASIVDCLLSSHDINSRGKNGWTPVMKAAYYCEINVFDMLVTKGADITLTDDNGDTILNIACQRGNRRTTIVEELLLSSDINIRGNHDRTPVMNAAICNTIEIFDLLVKKGANVTLIDRYGDNVLHKACESGNILVINQCIPLLNINLRGRIGQTPIMKAVVGGHIEVLEILLNHQADATLRDWCGNSLLHLACENGNPDLVNRVWRYSEVDMRNHPGWTPAMLALVYGQPELFQHLKDKGADVKLVDNVGDDILTLAQRGGCTEILQQLSPAGKEKPLVEKWSNTMLSLVYGLIPMDNFEHVSEDLVQRDGFGDTLLHLACRGGNLRCVEYLLPSYDINVRGRYGWTPVMMAARCEHMDVLQCLISHKADLSLVSDTGEDVLCLARRGTNTDIVTFLLTLPDFSDTG